MRARRAEQYALRDDHTAASARLEAVGHVFQEQDLGRRRAADLHVVDDAVLVDSSAERRVGENNVIAVERQAELAPLLPIQRRRQHVAAVDSDIGEAAQRQVHRGKVNHLYIDVVAVER